MDILENLRTMQNLKSACLSFVGMGVCISRHILQVLVTLAQFSGAQLGILQFDSIPTLYQVSAPQDLPHPDMSYSTSPDY